MVRSTFGLTPSNGSPPVLVVEKNIVSLIVTFATTGTPGCGVILNQVIGTAG
jgi:hypothetical protein